MKTPEKYTNGLGLDVSEMLVFGENKNRETIHNYAYMFYYS